MRKIVLLLIILCVFAGVKAQTWFHNSAHISEVKLVFEQENWDYFLDSFYVDGDEERLLAAAWVDGVYYDSIGVRYKGFSSVSVNRQKNPFNIKLDYVNDQNHYGVEKIKLGNVIQDPSFAREILSYKIARNYMPTSLANYCKVYINDVFWGVYTSVESVDKSFLAQHFGSSDGAFIKGNPSTVNLNGGNSNLSNNPGTDTSDYYDYYELKSDAGWAEFYTLIEKLNNNTGAIEEVLNVDHTLWMHALNYTLVNFDSYIGYAQNYYLYKDDNGQFNPILWDLNQSFGSFRLTDASDYFRGFTVEEAKTMDPLAHVNSFSVHPRPLIKNVINTDQRERMYLAHIRAIVQENFANDSYKTELTKLQELIKADVTADTNKFYSNQDFFDNKTSTVRDLVEYPGLTDLMDARSTYLLNYKGISPIGAPSITEPENDKSENSVQITSAVANATAVYLYYRDEVRGLFSRMEMKDDGLSGDEKASDGIHTATIPTFSNTVDYYVYAENDSAGTFSPSNAAYNFYEIREIKKLVINEFCASNNTINTDENGQFEDWIEIHNNGDTTIVLLGYSLSDDIDDLGQWSFPDVSISSGEYMLIWADKDEEDGTLHTNFKLSAGGDAIYLSYGKEIRDEVTFGGQTTDITTGRYPDGTGPFVLMEPSPEAFNSGRRLSVKKMLEYGVSVFPNPVTNRLFVQSEIAGDIEIINSNGQVLFNGVANKGINQYDMTMLTSGLYFLILHNDRTRITKKLLKI